MSYTSEMNPNPSRLHERSTWVALAVSLFVMVMSVSVPVESTAEPLEYHAFAALDVQANFSWINGRMGFEQEIGGIGTLNDFRNDLGLPQENRTLQINLAVRPLEHHVLRMYGRIPEYYTGETIATRELRTRLVSLNPPTPHIYPAGTEIKSELRTAMFGFGYDLDLLVGPRWYGGLNGDLKYLDLQVRMGSATSSLEDTITLDELIPCLGAHVQTRWPFLADRIFAAPTAGGFARMAYGITPNFLNYVDCSMGLTCSLRPSYCAAIEAKVGYEHESVFHNQEIGSGRTVELKRDGIFVSLDAIF
ncbi:MAG TPA: hypothetical protein VK463_01890 [Desulfomonilaceae bacterium]|nr:hypothetical protein [Desulfomonilaceae bacterium]